MKMPRSYALPTNVFDETDNHISCIYDTNIENNWKNIDSLSIAIISIDSLSSMGKSSMKLCKNTPPPH